MRILYIAVLFTLAACSPGGGAPEGQPGPPARPVETATPGADSARPPEATSPGAGDASTSAPDTTSCGPYSVITGAGLGGLRVGATVAEVKRTCEVVDDHIGPGAEGMTERYIVVDFDTARVRAIVVDDRVWRVQITSDAFHTADSVGVGTPLARMLRIPGIRGAEGEGRLFVFSPERCGLSFRLSHIPRGSEHRGAWSKEALQALPAETVVDVVLAFGCGADG